MSRLRHGVASLQSGLLRYCVAVGTSTRLADVWIEALTEPARFSHDVRTTFAQCDRDAVASIVKKVLATILGVDPIVLLLIMICALFEWLGHSHLPMWFYLFGLCAYKLVLFAFCQIERLLIDEITFNWVAFLF